jgi:hypothetical protein
MIIRNLANKVSFPSMLRLRSAQAPARGDLSGRAGARTERSRSVEAI